MAILFPEFIVCCAVSQLVQARRIRRCWEDKFKDFDNESVKSWLGMSGAFFVVMGGFVVQDEKKPKTATSKESARRDVSSSSSSKEEEKDVTTTICLEGFKALLESGILSEGIKEGTFTEAHFASCNIEDKGKADGITKFLVVIQILWMAVQCIGRKANGLPVTLLEIHVLTQILFSTITYFSWWNKPLDVAEPIVLSLDAARLLEAGIVARQERYSLNPMLNIEHTRQGGIIRMFYRTAYDLLASFVVIDKADKFEISATILGLLSCGIHAAAWNFHFPTEIERLLWRIASIGIGSMPLLLCLTVYGLGGEVYCQWTFYDLHYRGKPIHRALLQAWKRGVDGDRPEGAPENKKFGSSKRLPPWASFLHYGVAAVFAFGYFLSVLYLTIESFVSVRSLPKGAYSTVEWSDFFPHI